MTNYGNRENRSFDSLILVAVEAGMSDVLGESVKEVIFYHLDKKYSLRRNNIPNKLEAFTDALKNLFGPGAEAIENLVVKQLYKELNIRSEEISEPKFIRRIEWAREKFMTEKISLLPRNVKVEIERTY